MVSVDELKIALDELEKSKGRLKKKKGVKSRAEREKHLKTVKLSREMKSAQSLDLPGSEIYVAAHYEGKLLNEYGIKSERIPVNIKIVRAPIGYTPIYDVYLPDIGEGTWIVLDRIRSEITAEVGVRGQEVLDMELQKRVEKLEPRESVGKGTPVTLAVAHAADLISTQEGRYRPYLVIFSDMSEDPPEDGQTPRDVRSPIRLPAECEVRALYVSEFGGREEFLQRTGHWEDAFRLWGVTRPVAIHGYANSGQAARDLIHYISMPG